MATHTGTAPAPTPLRTAARTSKWTADEPVPVLPAAAAVDALPVHDDALAPEAITPDELAYFQATARAVNAAVDDFTAAEDRLKGARGAFNSYGQHLMAKYGDDAGIDTRTGQITRAAR